MLKPDVLLKPNVLDAQENVSVNSVCAKKALQTLVHYFS